MTVREYQEAARAAVRGGPIVYTTKPIAKIQAIPLEEAVGKRDEAERARLAAETRKKNLDACYGEPHEWEFVRKGRDPVGKHTKSGYLVKEYAVIICRTHPEEGEVVAGIGEAKTYAGLTLTRPKAGRPPKRRAELDKEW